MFQTFKVVGPLKEIPPKILTFCLYLLVLGIDAG